MKEERYVYRIDAEDVIVFVSDAWLGFAIDNGAPELSREAVTGRPIWDFIAGMETRHLYRLILERVRGGPFGVTIPNRCDSPALRRFMEMDMAPLPDSSVEFRCRTLKTEKRSPVALLDPSAGHSDKTLTICSWCKRVRMGAERWVEVEEATSELALFNELRLPMLTHGICPPCYGIFMKPWHRPAG